MITTLSSSAEKKEGTNEVWVEKDREVREKGKLVLGEVESTQNESSQDFLIVVDPKRRKIDNEIDTDNSVIGSVSHLDSHLSPVSKNFKEAGLGLQARQVL